jgi:hypothetical protein
MVKRRAVAGDLGLLRPLGRGRSGQGSVAYVRRARSWGGGDLGYRPSGDDRPLCPLRWVSCRRELVGKKWDEAKILKAAHAFEKTGTYTVRPERGVRRGG